MNLILIAACACAVVALLVMGYVLWSSRSANLRELQRLIDLSKVTIEDLNDQIAKRRENELLLREANRKLKDTIELERKAKEQKEQDVLHLKRQLNHQRNANEKLNEMLGAQEEHIRKQDRDITMLKDQVSELRAKLGMEP